MEGCLSGWELKNENQHEPSFEVEQSMLWDMPESEENVDENWMETEIVRSGLIVFNRGRLHMVENHWEGYSSNLTGSSDNQSAKRGSEEARVQEFYDKKSGGVFPAKKITKSYHQSTILLSNIPIISYNDSNIGKTCCSI